MPEKVDIVIIGGGVMGCAIAYNLAKEGLKPVVIEKSDIGGEASGSNGGGVRQSARNLKEMPLAMESIQIYGQLHEELGMDVEYVREGNLRLCTSEEELEAMRQAVENQKKVGLELVMLDRRQVLDINPHVGDKVIGASFCPTDGHVNPFLVTYGFFKKAKSLGAKFYTHEEAREIRMQKGRVTGVVTGADASRSSAQVGLLAPVPAWRAREKSRSFVLGICAGSGLIRPLVGSHVYQAIGSLGTPAAADNCDTRPQQRMDSRRSGGARCLMVSPVPWMP